MKLAARRPYIMRARAVELASTRDRIAHAMLQLALKQAYEQITLAAIADAAGVSHQTVLNHFDSKEGVAAAAADILVHQTGQARARAAPGDRAGALEVLVGEYERIGDANARWAMSSEQLGSLAGRLDDARASHQAWLEWIFAKQLPATPVARRRAIIALHAATDVYTWKLLRRDLGLTREETERIMGHMMDGILGSATPTRGQARQKRRGR